MQYTDISPIPIYGEWDEGYALDTYVVKSTFLGTDEQGHDQFDNTRSLIGEYLYSMKYNGHIDTSRKILSLSIPFLDDWFSRITVNGVIPVPPTEKNRNLQPVFSYASAVAGHYNLPYSENILSKSSSVQSKSIGGIKKDLSGTIDMIGIIKSRCNILLIDDLFQSGETASECVKVLKSNPLVEKVYLLSIAKNKNSR